MTTTFRPEGFPQRPMGNPPGTPVPPLTESYAATYTAPVSESHPADALPPVAPSPLVFRASGALVAASITQAMIAGFFVLAGAGALASGHPGLSPFILFGLFNAHRVLCVRFATMGRAQSPLLRGPILCSLVLNLCYAVALIGANTTAPHSTTGLFTALAVFVLGINALTLPHLKDAR